MKRPTIHELECFVAVAEELSFSKAARRLNLSQPPLSRQLQSLEGKLSARLLDRNTRVVSLTGAGRLFLDDARSILARLDASSSAIRRVSEGEVKRLRIAFVGALLDDALVKQLQAFRARHLDCQLHMMDMPPAEQWQALKSGEVDGAFVGVAPTKLDKKLGIVIWKREPLNVVLPENHRLVPCAEIKLAELKSESWVMVSRAAAPAFRDHVKDLCAGVRFQPLVVQESDRVAAVLTMIAAGQGISVLPAGLSRLLTTGVVFKPLAGSKAMLSHAFAFRQGAPEEPITAFAHLLRSQKSLK